MTRARSRFAIVHLVLAGLVLAISLTTSTAQAENIRRLGTWNMKWLGGPSGSQLDAVENVPGYAEHILSTGATFFALQEICPTHLEDGQPRCDYLDRIVDALNASSGGAWEYLLDMRNGSQRLAFLFDGTEWSCSDARTIWPGSSYRSLRRPFITTVTALGTDVDLTFTAVNIHMKAFEDEAERRTEQFDELAAWIMDTDIDDEDVLILGDTNIFFGQADTDDAMNEIGFEAIYDPERTAIHNGELGQRLDRIYASANLMVEIERAKDAVDHTTWIDSHKEIADGDFAEFEENFSDHFPVTVVVDVGDGG